MDGTADAAWPPPAPGVPGPLPPSTTLPTAAAVPAYPAAAPAPVAAATNPGAPPADPRPPELGVPASWRFAFAFGWALVLLALSRLVLTARHLELAPRWDAWWPVPFLLGVLVLAAAVLDRGAFAASVAGTLVLGFMAGLDLQGGRVGLGRYEAALTLSAAVLTLVVRAAPLTEVRGNLDGPS